MKLNFLGNLSSLKSAFIKETQDGYNNMLLMDCGDSAVQGIKKTGVLDDVDLVILFLSHQHPDHIGGVPYLIKKCKNDGIDLAFLLSSYGTQRKQILHELTKKHNVPSTKIETIASSHAASLMGFHDIDYDILHHNVKTQTTALIMKKKTIGGYKKTIFAADHNSKAFIKKVIQDQNLEDLYTDCTKKHNDSHTVHFPFNRLTQIVPPDIRHKVTLMHGSCDLYERARIAGFNTADQFIYERPW